MGIKRPVVCLAAVDWSYLFHRPQQLMLRLAKIGHPVHYRNPAQVAGAAREAVAPNLWVYRDFGQLPEGVGDAALYFIYYPPYIEWLKPGGDQFIIYDCIDDDPVFDSHEAQLVQRAGLVICVSRSLLEKHREKAARCLLLSNGVDLRHYQGGRFPIPEELRRFKAAPKTLIGFSGAFYRGWVDMELVYQVAYSRPRWVVVIVGESYQWDFSGAPPNLVYLGPRPYAQLPQYVSCFDAGWIPFLDNRIARGADPVKLYEYAAAGIPVISRNLPFVAGLNPPLVYPYQTPADCLTAINRALYDNRQQPHQARLQRWNFAAGRSWDSITQNLLDELSRLTWLER